MVMLFIGRSSFAFTVTPPPWKVTLPVARSTVTINSYGLS